MHAIMCECSAIMKFPCFHVNDDLIQGSRVAILVPDDMVEQAQIFIQARCSGPDFYDYAFDSVNINDTDD